LKCEAGRQTVRLPWQTVFKIGALREGQGEEEEYGVVEDLR